ncbi:MAG: apolipoprotein N-acyltransferase [Desulfobacteraceae bacterium]
MSLTALSAIRTFPPAMETNYRCRISLLAAALSGLLLTASFPPGSTRGFAWIALVPLLAALRDRSKSLRFYMGLTAGLVHFLSLMYWIIVVLKGYGGLPLAISMIVLLALTAYLALYPAFFALLFPWMWRSRFALLLTAGTWVILEYVRGEFLTGLPWCFIGHSQGAHPILIQICDFAGVYGVSFLVVSVNVLVFTLLFDRDQGFSRLRKLEGGVILLFLILTLLYGGYRLHDIDARVTKGTPLRAAVIQGNIDQSLKWRPAFQKATVDVYTRLSLQASPFHPDLLVWPETAVPYFFQEQGELSDRIAAVAENTGADLLFGSPAYDRSEDHVRYFNRAYLLSTDDRSVLWYDKVHLVPFGEYVPLKRFFPFINRLVPAAGDFAPGRRIAPLQGPGYAAGVLICFEAIFPDLARHQARQGAQVLVNLTNDAWFGRTSAPFQHLSMSAFRSVETRLPMIRAANTGISAFVDACGRITQRSGLFHESVLIAPVSLPSNRPTFYTRYGDLFVFLLLIPICGKLIRFIMIRRFRRLTHPA